jgi:hypothetical protein
MMSIDDLSSEYAHLKSSKLFKDVNIQGQLQETARLVWQIK